MKLMRGASWVVGAAVWAVACSSETPGASNESGGTGGTGATGGSGGATGGASTSGGMPATGGANATGGAGGSVGGSAGTSSQAGTGAGAGVTAVGGASGAGGSSGGTPSSGGAPVGGSAGAPIGGDAGATLGGAGGTGGAPEGGTAGAPAGGSAGSMGGSGPVVEKPKLVTSANNMFWQTGMYAVVTNGTADVTVSESGTQTWHCFGGTFNEAGWDALSVLPADQKALAVKLLFDAADGAKFDCGRIPIGASDYAMSRYTLAETANDYMMTSFSIARDQEKLIPFIQAAQGIRSTVRFWASPWTPPAWLKTNNSTDAVSGRTPPYAAGDGMMKSDDQSLTAYALYLTKFVQEYAKVGITVSAIHPQNEPGYGNPYPSAYWPSDLYIKFIRQFLGPKFKTDLPTTEIWGGTMSAPGDGDMAVALSNDATAMQYVKGFGLQWNTRNKIATLKGKNLPIMQTEHKCGNYSFATDYWDQSRYDANKPQNDFAYGVESWKNIRDWVKSGVNAYSAWNMVLDTLGTNLNQSKPWHQNALLVVDRNAKTLIRTPAYWVFRHLSQYVVPMSTVVNASGGDALAFKNPDGSFVVVAYNEGNAKPGMIVQIGSTKLQFDMPANGWATLNYKP